MLGDLRYFVEGSMICKGSAVFEGLAILKVELNVVFHGVYIYCDQW